MVVYMNGYFEYSRAISAKAKKNKLKAKMLKDKVTKGNVEAGQIIDVMTKRV